LASEAPLRNLGKRKRKKKPKLQT